MLKYFKYISKFKYVYFGEKTMNDYELLKLSEKFDEGINLYDFTPEELQQIIDSKQKSANNFKQKYFEFYDDVKSESKKREDW